MLFGLLLDEATLADVAAELHTTGNRVVQVMTAPLWMALLSLYSLSTFMGLLAAGFLSKLAPALFTPLFEALLDKVVPEDASYQLPPELRHTENSSCSSLGMSSMELGGKRGCSSRGSSLLSKGASMGEAGGQSPLQVPQ